jgi:hypothetical protein
VQKRTYDRTAQRAADLVPTRERRTSVKKIQRREIGNDPARALDADKER